MQGWQQGVVSAVPVVAVVWVLMRQVPLVSTGGTTCC